MPKIKSKLGRKTPQTILQSIRRQHENTDMHDERVSTIGMARSRRHAQESSIQRELRMLRQRIQSNENRYRESTTQRVERLEKQCFSTSMRKKNESNIERKSRLEKDRLNKVERRKTETSPERRKRLEEQRQRKAERADNNENESMYRWAMKYNQEYDYLKMNEVEIGKMNKICEYCNAKKWKEETPSLCCALGKVVLPEIEEPPEPLKSLINGSHALSKRFLENVRKYNALFQMTSFGAKEVREGNFMPTFKIQGQIYHYIGSLLPRQGKAAQFLQIYFISEAEQLITRMNKNENLDRELIEILQKIIKENNSYIKSFRYNLEKNLETLKEEFKIVIHADRVPVNEHMGRYNAPNTNEVAILLVDEDKGPRDIVLNCRDGGVQRLSEFHRAYDSLQYPLMFVRGEDGYYLNIPQQKNTNSERNKTVTCMQFYAYRFMVRENSMNYLHYYKNLLNQYCVDMMAKMITERLDYIRRNQKKMRVDDYIHLRDTLNQDGNMNSENIGQFVILPSTFTGSPRYMHEKTQDAMTYVRNYGRPDLFITFTCNPEWPEIRNELFSGQKSYDRHDIVSRVFNLKMKKLINLCTKSAIFGRVRCYMYSVEWQKRGLPHCHILLWLQTKIQPDEIDNFISAELPDKKRDPMLYEIVCKNMIHGPCGMYNTISPCMKNNRCSKRYPRNFLAETETGNDGYPTYRRRNLENGGQTAKINLRGKTVEIDNRWVVPYCPMLLRCFVAHINVEYCHSVQAIKYICKYINKGSDQATFTVQNKRDEIKNYINGRYISTSEAMWRFFEFQIHERYPAIIHLAVHLENGQRVYFTEKNLKEVYENPKKTTLMAFFELCRNDDFAKTLLYHEVPMYYTWNKNLFIRRKRGEDVEGYPGIKKDTALGRVYTIHPKQTECFYLRMLLHHVRGPKSFENIRTINGVLKSTFQEACQDLGLLENDNQWKDTLAEAAILRSALRMRELFAIILVFCQPGKPRILWETFKQSLCEDILLKEQRRYNDKTIMLSEEMINQGLCELEDKVVALSEKYLVDYGMPIPKRSEKNAGDLYDVILKCPFDKRELEDYVNENLPKLVQDQREAFEKIIKSVMNNRGKIFFLDAPGGTGKTFLINLLLAKVRSTCGIAIGVASSGIAATLISGGRTAHSVFKLPLNVFTEKETVCSIRKNGRLGKILQETKLIVWDECTMSHRAHIEAIERTLRDLKSCNKLMGGITMVYAGDFRQTLPVIAKGTRADIVKACIKSSWIWNDMEKLNLRTNMRAHYGGGDKEFTKKLLEIGEGKIENEKGIITIDQRIGKIVNNIIDLIWKVYPEVENILQKNYQWLCERAIVSPRNDSMEEINNIILDKLNGEIKEYKSIDTVINSEDAVHYPHEFLNSLKPSGFPPHHLKLKVGAPIILLRNLNPPNLCNGTRLQIKVMHTNIIEAIILNGAATGEIAYIPRIPMIPTDLPFQFRRLQFPIKVSFAITINKSQGQTFKYIGIDLRKDCFSHGQLYVGLSRTGNAENQFILIPEYNKTKNIIYPEVL